MGKIVGVEVLAAAETELLEAISYYNEQSEGLGFDLTAEVQRTIERIHPAQSPIIRLLPLGRGLIRGVANWE